MRSGINALFVIGFTASSILSTPIQSLLFHPLSLYRLLRQRFTRGMR
ncbi:MAG: hypothetical protein R3E67_08865 [Pseudomonadales bacterium]